MFAKEPPKNWIGISAQKKKSQEGYKQLEKDRKARDDGL